MSLPDLGFEPLQEKVYRALLDEPNADRARLATLAGGDADAVGIALAGLVTLGVARADDGCPAGYTLANPAVAIAELIEQVERNLLRQHRRVVDTRAELLELSARFQYAPAPGGTDVERLDGPAVSEALAELSFFTRSSVYAVQPGGTRPVHAFRTHRPLHLRALRRGIDLRLLCHEEVLADAEGTAHVRELRAGGAQFRVTGQAIDPIIILDESVAVIPTDSTDGADGALVVRQRNLLNGFVRLYHRMWGDGRNVTDDDKTAVDTPLAPNDRKVLELLAAGTTDEAAARAVGWSARHLRRRVASLMTQLGASSRFEAGVAAAHRGWI